MKYLLIVTTFIILTTVNTLSAECITAAQKIKPNCWGTIKPMKMKMPEKLNPIQEKIDNLETKKNKFDKENKTLVDLWNNYKKK